MIMYCYQQPKMAEGEKQMRFYFLHPVYSSMLPAACQGICGARSLFFGRIFLQPSLTDAIFWQQPLWYNEYIARPFFETYL